MAITIEKIIGSSEGNPDTGLTARNKINSNFKNLVDAILSIQVEAGTTSFNNLTDKPTTLAGYGITDAAGRYHTHTFSVLEGKPTTIEGYGISDAYGKSQIDTFLNGKLNSSVFNDLFEKVNIGTELSPVYAIKAKYDFYSIGGISALGEGISGGGGTGGLDYEALQTLLTGSTNAYEINAAFLTAITSGYITGKLGTTYSLSSHNHDSLYSALAHSHNLSSLTNDVGFITSSALDTYATKTYVNTAVNNLINGAPAARDTLKEISDILDANINSIGDITTAISTKWTQDNTKISNWDTAFTNSHTHSNKTFLDSLTSELIGSFYNPTNSNLITVDWNAKNMLVNSVLTVNGESNLNGELKTTKNIYLNNSSENSLYSNNNQISFIKYDSDWAVKSRLTISDSGVDILGVLSTSNLKFGAYTIEVISNELVFSLSGVIKAKLTTDGFISTGGITALG